MDSPIPPLRPLSAAKAAAFAAAYAILIVLEWKLPPGPSAIRMFWPAPGFLIAGLLVRPAGRRIRLFALAAAAGLAAHLAAGPNPEVAAGFWFSDLAAGALAVFLVLRIPGGDGFLGNLKGTVRFFTMVIPAAAGCGALSRAALGDFFLGTGWASPLATGFLADSAGLAVLVPVALAWAQRDQAWDSDRWRHARFGLCAGLSLTVGFLTFSQPAWLFASLGRPLPYAIFPFLMWAALDFGPRGSATLHLCLYLMGAWLDFLGHGPTQLGQKLGAGLVGPLQWFPYFASFCSLGPAVLVRRQRRIEEELRMRESRYGSLWSSKLIGIYVFDLHSRIVEANDTFLAMLGVDRKELEAGGIPIAPMTTPEHLADMPGLIKRFRADGHLGPFEREWVLRDGRRLLSLVYTARMEEPDRALGMVMDVHELDLARKELRLRDSRYRGLLSSNILGVFVSSVDGKIAEANDAFLAMIRRKREDLEAGRIHSRDMVTPDYLSGSAERKRQFESEGRMGPYDREWVLQDGSRLNTLFFATRLENGDALCMVFDTDELKRTKLELRAVESRFKKLLDANILGVAVVNERNVIEEANAAFLSITGYTPGDLASGAITGSALTVARSRESLQNDVRELIETGTLSPKETEWTRKDGNLVPVYRGVTRLDESDRWLTVALDLSDTKRIQAELRAAKQTAEAASVAKSDFLAHMSHEIRTPLNGVLGMLSLLQDTRLNPEQTGYARSARDSGTHLLALINQILDFSKIEGGHVEIVVEPFALAAAVDGAFAAVSEPARKKGILLSKRMDPALPVRLYGDPTCLRQVLLNLLGNAVKFSPGGTVEVTVRLLERKGDRCRIDFEVSDQGPGIPMAAMERLFQPFRQGDDSMARAAGGTGLGLAISRELARRMGGEIRVESEVGRGSRFRFHIEADALADGPEASVAGAAGKEPGAGFLRGSRFGSLSARVLIADDHPVNVNVAAIMLRKMGCEVDAFPDGASALAAAAEREYDLVFMDCQMPGLDGFETTRRLRAREAKGLVGKGLRQRVPVIALTAHAVAGMREKCLAAGMDDYLTKPFSAEDLDVMIRKWLIAGAPPEGEIVLDLARLSALDDGSPQGKENTRHLAEMFLESGRESWARIRAEQGSGDGPALAKSLHRFKGSCATVGAVALANRLKAMETTLKDLGPEALGEDVEILGELMARTESAMAGLAARSVAKA
jgi:PAS domain S-box-containing protein